MGHMNRTLALAWMVACGSGDRGTMDAGDSGAPVRVTLQTIAPPLLVGFRPESSPDWQMFEPDGKSTFEFMATGLYRIVVACDNSSGGSSVYEYARTPADVPVITIFCGASPFIVRGTVGQPGLVGLGVNVATTSAQLSFQLLAGAGSFDLVHLFSSGTAEFDQIGLRRDVAILGDTDLGLVDLSQSSQALVPKRITVTNLATSETVGLSTLIYSGNSIVAVPSSGPPTSVGTAQLVPEGMLRATDRQVLDVRAGTLLSGTTMSRLLRRDIHVGDPEMVALPDPLGQVTFTLTGDRLVATASTLPDHDRIFLSRQSDAVGPGVNAHGIIVSRSFREASGAATTILDLSDVPGLRPSWQIDPATQRFVFTASRGTSADNMMTSSTAIQFTSARQTRSASGRMRTALWPEDPAELLSE